MGNALALLGKAEAVGTGKAPLLNLFCASAPPLSPCEQVGRVERCRKVEIRFYSNQTCLAGYQMRGDAWGYQQRGEEGSGFCITQEDAKDLAGDACPSWSHRPPLGAGRDSCSVLKQLWGSLMKESVSDGQQERVSLFFVLMVAITCLTPLPH